MIDMDVPSVFDAMVIDERARRTAEPAEFDLSRSIPLSFLVIPDAIGAWPELLPRHETHDIVNR
jgi:hypothetical protein